MTDLILGSQAIDRTSLRGRPCCSLSRHDADARGEDRLRWWGSCGRSACSRNGSGRRSAGRSCLHQSGHPLRRVRPCMAERCGSRSTAAYRRLLALATSVVVVTQGPYAAWKCRLAMRESSLTAPVFSRLRCSAGARSTPFGARSTAKTHLTVAPATLALDEWCKPQ